MAVFGDAALRPGYPIRYWSRIRNIGDAINPAIIQHLTGLEPFACHDVTQDHVLPIGSIMFMASPASYIWGSGMLTPGQNIAAVTPGRVCAVRGELTRAVLRERFGRLGDIPVGDPGIFVDELPEVRLQRRLIPVTRKAVAIPHHGSMGHPYFATLAEDPDCLVLSPLTDRLDFFQALLSAEVVITQSLHGLIFAEALEKPSVWIGDRSDAPWRHKFLDWFSTTRAPREMPAPFGTPLAELLAMADRCGCAIDRAALRQSLPRLTPTPIPARIGFDVGRRAAPFVFLVQRGAYVPPSVDVDGVIVAMPGEEAGAIAGHVGRMRAICAEPLPFLLVYDEALYRSLSVGLLDRLRKLLDLNGEVGFIQLAGHRLPGPPPDPSWSGTDGMNPCGWLPDHLGQGIVLVRAPRHLDWQAPGMTLALG